MNYSYIDEQPNFYKDFKIGCFVKINKNYLHHKNSYDGRKGIIMGRKGPFWEVNFDDFISSYLFYDEELDLIS